MREVRCDRCDLPVEPSNNTKVYDAAFQALTGYESKTELPFEVVVVPTFAKGEIIPGNPEASIQNVLCTHRDGRHFLATKDCEGSPTRRKHIKGVWGNGEGMEPIMAEAAKRAYVLMLGASQPTATQS